MAILLRALLPIAACLGLSAATGNASPGPVPVAPTAPTTAPADRPFPGVLSVAVDATDLDRRVFRVHEVVPVAAGPLTLLYPQWIPGAHAPEGPIDKFAGLIVRANGARLDWTRDDVDMFAFHVTVPRGVATLDLEFQYLSPVSADVGAAEVSSDILILEWTSVALYPAGYFTRQIPVEASVTLPPGWEFATALERTVTNGNTTGFRRTTFETLGDSPLYAGRHHREIDLTPAGSVPVRLQVFADRPDQLLASDAQLAAHRALVTQAYRLYGSHHYDHYDFLFSLSDRVHFAGTEHHQSSEDGLRGNYFTEWDKGTAGRTLLAHEYTHSWNGKFRRPADLWTPTYNVPMRNSLLWVYEGQTEYWGEVLTSRANLWTRAEALDSLAATAAFYDHMAGREWRTLADTTNDEIINPRRPMSWETWQRFEDYYSEAQLIWLDVDTLIRERSGNARSLDDFARRFYSINDGSYVPVTYRFADVVAALNAVEPYDWAAFLNQRVYSHTRGAPLDGIARGGYRLSYDDTPNLYTTSHETEHKSTDLLYSLGLSAEHDGTLREVVWEGPAFKAGLTAGTQLVAIDGATFEPELLKDAVRLAKGTSTPIRLLVKTNNRFRTVEIDYHNGLRYPHLVRDPQHPALLDAILAPKG